MLSRLLDCLNPKPVQTVRLPEETVVATWGLNLRTVAAALDAQAEGAAELAEQILRERGVRRPAANPPEAQP